MLLERRGTLLLGRSPKGTQNFLGKLANPSGYFDYTENYKTDLRF